MWVEPPHDPCPECKAKGGHLPKCPKHAEWKASLAKQPNAAATVPQGEQTAPETTSKPLHNWKLCYAKAKEKGIPQEDVKLWYTEEYGVESGNDLTPEQFQGILDWIASN